MAPSKKRRSRKEFVLLDTEKPFPFMSLPPEIRLMIYDVLIRKQTALGKRWRVPADVVFLSDYHTTLSSRVKSLLKVKDIRAELFFRLVRKYKFEWDGSGNLEINRRWMSFKRYVLPFINNLTVSIHDPEGPFKRHTTPFRNILAWMRWRSQHSHLYPWQLKSLMLREASRKPRDPNFQWTIAPWIWMSPSQMMYSTEHKAYHFLKGAPMVPRLDSLKIVLKNMPHPEAAEAFFARCARCGIDGKLGLLQWDQRMVADWLQFDNGLLVLTTA